MAGQREAKEALYGQFARIGRAVGSPYRLEILELLAQGDRTVESLASEIGLSLANASQHLQALREASLVERRKEGLFAYYRLADPAVFELCAAVRRVAEQQLADVERIVRRHFGDRADADVVRMPDLLARVRSGDVVILDARPLTEYRAGHIAGAISVPIEKLQRQLRTLPADREYVAYCRGPYCIYADRAVEQLKRSGRQARRLLEGFPEWQAAGYPVARGDESPVGRPRSPRPAGVRQRRRLSRTSGRAV